MSDLDSHSQPWELVLTGAQLGRLMRSRQIIGLENSKSDHTSISNLIDLDHNPDFMFPSGVNISPCLISHSTHWNDHSDLKRPALGVEHFLRQNLPSINIGRKVLFV